jgi:hypothetical protein
MTILLLDELINRYDNGSQDGCIKMTLDKITKDKMTIQNA